MIPIHTSIVLARYLNARPAASPWRHLIRQALDDAPQAAAELAVQTHLSTQQFENEIAEVVRRFLRTQLVSGTPKQALRAAAAADALLEDPITGASDIGISVGALPDFDRAAVQALAQVSEERERAARVCDDEARIRAEAGTKHPEDSPARDRCYAAARAARNCAAGIRGGENPPAPKTLPDPITRLSQASSNVWGWATSHEAAIRALPKHLFDVVQALGRQARALERQEGNAAIEDARLLRAAAKFILSRVAP